MRNTKASVTLRLEILSACEVNGQVHQEETRCSTLDYKIIQIDSLK